MADVTVKTIDEMEGIFGGMVRRARAELGVTSFGMQVLTLPAGWDGYPDHHHGPDAQDPNQEEVYIPVSGSATLLADGAEYELVPGAWPVWARPSGAGSSRGPTGSASLPSAARPVGRSPPRRGPSSAPSRRSRRSSLRGDGRGGGIPARVGAGRRPRRLRSSHRRPSPRAPRPLLPHARLLSRRRGRGAGARSCGPGGARHVRGAGAAAGLALPDRHERLPRPRSSGGADQPAGWRRRPSTTSSDEVAWLSPIPTGCWTSSNRRSRSSSSGS